MDGNEDEDEVMLALEANEDEGDFSYAISGSELQLDSRK